MLLDIHSHYAAPIAGESIWNVEPAVFSPIEGNYYSVGTQAGLHAGMYFSVKQ